MNQKKIGVIILNYNGWKDTIKCADSVLTGRVIPDWLVIVDNASKDESLFNLQKWQQRRKEKNIVLLAQQVNNGYAAGNNTGIRWLLQKDIDGIWLLNNDTLVEKNALGALVERLFNKNGAGLCGSLILYMDRADTVQCRGGGTTNWLTFLSRQNGNFLKYSEALRASTEEVESELDYIYGASVMASREFIEEIGLLDENLFLYCEEQDWALRARGKFLLAYAPESVVWHKEGETTGTSWRGIKLKSLACLAKSRIKVTLKHQPWALPTVLLGFAFALIRKIMYKLNKRAK